MLLQSTHEQAVSKQGVIQPVTSATPAITKTTDVFKLTEAISRVTRIISTQQLIITANSWLEFWKQTNPCGCRSPLSSTFHSEQALPASGETSPRQSQGWLFHQTGMNQLPPALAPCSTHPLVLVCTEETSVMPLLDDDVGDARLVILFQFDAGISDCQELIVKDLERQGHTE